MKALGTLLVIIIVAFAIVGVIVLILNQYDKVCKAKDLKRNKGLNDKHSHLIGVRGYLNTESGSFVGEDKLPIAELNDFQVFLGIGKYLLHSVYIPCKIKEFEQKVYRGKDYFYCHIDPVQDETFEFEVKYVSQINVAMSNKDLGDVFMPIENFWKCKVGDIISLKWEVKQQNHFRSINLVRA